MKNSYYWMAVTADEYELPLAVEDSARALAERLGMSPNSIKGAIKRNWDGQRSGRRFYRVRKE
jgi:hypothetical protein